MKDKYYCPNCEKKTVIKYGGGYFPSTKEFEFICIDCGLRFLAKIIEEEPTKKWWQFWK